MIVVAEEKLKTPTVSKSEWLDDWEDTLQINLTAAARDCWRLFC